MTDYGYLFSKTLHKKLKDKVRAGVHVKSTPDDKLEIIIARTSENLIFTMYIDDFSTRLLNGYSTDYATYEIIEKYRRFNNKYYRKKILYSRNRGWCLLIKRYSFLFNITMEV